MKKMYGLMVFFIVGHSSLHADYSTRIFNNSAVEMTVTIQPKMMPIGTRYSGSTITQVIPPSGSNKDFKGIKIGGPYEIFVSATRFTAPNELWWGTLDIGSIPKPRYEIVGDLEKNISYAIKEKKK